MSTHFMRHSRDYTHYININIAILTRLVDNSYTCPFRVIRFQAFTEHLRYILNPLRRLRCRPHHDSVKNQCCRGQPECLKTAEQILIKV